MPSYFHVTSLSFSFHVYPQAFFRQITMTIRDDDARLSLFCTNDMIELEKKYSINFKSVLRNPVSNNSVKCLFMCISKKIKFFFWRVRAWILLSNFFLDSFQGSSFMCGQQEIYMTRSKFKISFHISKKKRWTV